MQKRSKSKAAIAIILSLFFVFATVITAAADNNNGDYDIVFVIDTSNSMNYSDSSQIALQAAELFANQVPAAVTRFGVVAYGKENKTLPLTSDKNKLHQFCDSLKYYQYGTDIPEGLMGAKALFESGGLNDNKKVIILLTDGIVEDTGRSSSQLSSDLEAVEKSGYTIYTIGLNGDKGGSNQVDEGYLQNIASKNNGKCYIVDSIDSLKGIFDEINGEIFDFDQIPVQENGDFSIDNDEVVEAIVDIYHESDISWTITGPNGENYTASSPEVSVKETDLYTAVNIFNPAVGKWNVSYIRNGTDKNTKIVPTVMLSYNVSAELELTPTDCGEPDPVKIEVKLNDSQNQIENRPDFFSKFTCTAKITAPDGSVETITLTPTANGYEGECSNHPKNDASYKVECTVKGSRLQKECGPKEFNCVSVDSIVPGQITNPSSTNPGPEDGGLPLWAIIAIIVGVLALIAVAIIIIKSIIVEPGEPLSGTIDYSWKYVDQNGLAQMSDNFLSWNLDSFNRKKVSILELLNNDPRFAPLSRVFLVGHKDENGNIGVAITVGAKKAKKGEETTDDVSVSNCGMPVGEVPSIIKTNTRVAIQFGKSSVTLTRRL